MGLTALIEAASVEYQINGVQILNEMSFRINRGEFVGLIGPNGAGKTTLMRVLAGLIQPTKGDVVFKGVSLRKLPDRDRARSIAFVSQNSSATFGFTVNDIVTMGRYPHKGKFAPPSANDRKAIAKAMEATDIGSLVDRRVHELSGGERQRVYIARALAQEPRLLFLDEPTANLDIRYQMDVLNLVRHLNDVEGLTIVMAIHDLTWALRYCSHLLALNAGNLVAHGPATTALTPKLIKDVFGVVGRVVVEPGNPPRVQFD